MGPAELDGVRLGPDVEGREVSAAAAAAGTRDEPEVRRRRILMVMSLRL